MIKLQELTPSIYYNQSRDFQFIGRLYDVVLNYILTNAEVIQNLPVYENTDQRFIDLLTLTLGFQSKHKYNTKQLTALCSAFSTIMRNKGNETAINIAINTLLRAEGITKKAYMNLSNFEFQLFIPEELEDLNLIYDLLDYALPCGISCTVYRGQYTSQTSSTELRYATQTVTAVKDEDPDPYGTNNVVIQSLTQMTVIPKIGAISSRDSRETNTTTNMTGYLNNMVIPKITKK